MPDSSGFLRALRVDEDYGTAAIVDRYVLTSNALRATRRVLETIDNGAGGAWTLVGPYGTGKSAFCLYLAHLLAAARSDATARATELLRVADARLARQLFPTPKKRFGIDALLASGSAQPISTAILRALAVSPVLQRRSSTASIQSKAKRLLRASNQRATPVPNDVLDLVAGLINSLKSNSATKGFLLVLDELGQLLEFAATRRDSAEVFLLQQLAELAARSNGRFGLIGVLHQDFREYAAMLPSVERAEWEKIRGRFEDITFEEPPSQLLRFVATASQQCRQADERPVARTTAKAVTELAPELWNLKIAPPDLARSEGRKLIQACAPLHPLVAVLLGPVFRRVGQNERSAFSFLASEEPTALRTWMGPGQKHGRKLFDIVDLHDHLLGSLGNALLHTADAKRWAEAFEAESRHHSLSPAAVATLRAIAILGIASRWYDIRASHDVLRFALSHRLPSDSLKKAITELKSASVIVHRKYNDSFVIWEGSDVDVEARLDEGRTRLRETSGAAALLNRHYRIRPLLARRHSFKTGTLRFFDIHFTDASQYANVIRETPSSDGRIVILLARNDEAPGLIKVAGETAKERTLVLVAPPDESLAFLALELAAVQWVERNTPELDHDPTARRELYARKADVDRQVRFQIDNLLAHANGASKWFYKGRPAKIASRRALNAKLSQICDQVFRDAPRLDNEIINRQELSSSAAAARRNLIEHMIEHRGAEHLDLQGNPPERSIYRSLLGDEGLGLHHCRKGVCRFRVPPRSHKNNADSAYELFEAIQQFLHASEEAARPLSELFDLLRQPPFGLRDGPIPVLVCAALLAREADVAVYRQGEFQPTLSSALFEDLIKRPGEFAVRQLRITGVRSEVFEKLGTLLGHLDVSRESARQQVVTIARLLMRFTRSLPEYAQKTEGLSERTSCVRHVLLTAKEPEIMLLTDLPQALELRPFKPKDRGRSKDVETYVDRLKTAIVELRDCFPKLTTSLWPALGEAFGVGVDTANIRPRLSDRSRGLIEFAVERDMRMLLERIADDSPTDEAWLDNVASLLAERLPSKWRDDDLVHFGIRLQQFARRIAALEATVASRPKTAKLNGAESIRFALTSTRLGQLDHAIHLDRRTEAHVLELRGKLSEVLANSDQTAAVAALCHTLHEQVASTPEPIIKNHRGASQ